jgi:protein SCO1/2
MSGPVMNNITNTVKMILSAGLLSLMAACNSAPSEGVPADAEPPLAGARIGGAFTLTNQDGGKTSEEQFKGKYRIIYFGYSYCPDVCPVDLANIMLGLKQAEKKSPALVEKIQPIFISVDPERDTPAVLKQYVSAFHPRLIGLTGTAEEIAAVAKKYLVDHSRQAYLFGPDGEPLALLPFDGTPQQVADEIARWVR